MNEPKPTTGVLGASWEFMRHFLLWTKNHYPELGPRAIQAMQLIMEEVSDTELQYVQQADAINFIVETFCTYVPARRVAQCLSDRMRHSYTQPNYFSDRLIQDMAGELAITHAIDLPPLGKPDLARHIRYLESEEDRDEELNDLRHYELCEL